MNGEKMLEGASDSAPLSRRDRFAGSAEVVAGFDLDRRKDLAASRDDVDLTDRYAIAARERCQARRRSGLAGRRSTVIGFLGGESKGAGVDGTARQAGGDGDGRGGIAQARPGERLA